MFDYKRLMQQLTWWIANLLMKLAYKITARYTDKNGKTWFEGNAL